MKEIKRILKPNGEFVLAFIPKNTMEKIPFSKYGFELYENEDLDLFGDDIDLIYNALPPSMHAEWSIKALQQGKHVLCEKPLATGIAAAALATSQMPTVAGNASWSAEGY